MIGFATNHDADRDKAVIAAGLRGHRHGTGNLKRAGHRHHLIAVPLFVQRRLGPFDQQVVEMVVEARLDDQEFGHVDNPYTVIERCPTTARS